MDYIKVNDLICKDQNLFIPHSCQKRKVKAESETINNYC